jgi:diguanylate cyclase (GGDEF)-like protein
LLFREPPILETHAGWIAFISIESLLLVALGWSLLGRHRAIIKLRELAIIDSLTGLFNRREFLRLMNDEVARIKRLPTVPTTVLMLDIDHFKSINDSYGHPGGDAALAQVGTIVRETVRRVDSVGRIGGEEFAILLVGTDLDNGVEFAERLRLTIAQGQVVYEGKSIQLTASIGVSQIDLRDNDAAVALARADKALYEAKDRGRNCVVSAPL